MTRLRKPSLYAVAVVLGAALVAYAPPWLPVGVYALVAVLGVVATWRRGGAGKSEEAPSRGPLACLCAHKKACRDDEFAAKVKV